MRYKNANIENLSEDIKSSLKKAVEEDKGLFFYGDTGVGKTYAISAISNSKGRGPADNFTMLLAEFRDYMQKGYYFENIKTYTDQDYVFIDDIGSEKTSEFVIEFLYILINKRYENMKRTVFATNLSINDFQERYGDRIMSRIAEMCILVEITGGDKRLN